MHLASGTRPSLHQRSARPKCDATPSTGSHIVPFAVDFGRLAACNAKSIRVARLRRRSSRSALLFAFVACMGVRAATIVSAARLAAAKYAQS